MDRASRANVGNDPRHTASRLRRMSPFLEPRQLNISGAFFEPPRIVQRATAGRSVLAAGLISVQRIGREPETVLHRKGHPGRDVILEFGERYHDIGISVSLV